MNSVRFRVRPLASVAEGESLSRIMGESFNFPAEKFKDRVEQSGPESFRVVERNGDPAGMLCLVPMGQWFGGRSVGCTGVSIVAVAPEHRGSGAAGFLMQEAMRELHQDGVPLSLLYPATQTLYRRAGYETAGTHYQYELRVQDAPVRDSGLEVRPIADADWPRVEEFQSVYARRFNGMLDRGPYIWTRIRDFRGVKSDGYLFHRDGEIEGFVCLTRRDPARALFGYDLQLADFAFTTPAGGRALLSFLARHRSLAHEVQLAARPGHPLFALMPEQPWRPFDGVDWMLRLTAVRPALEARGYPAGANGELHLEVADDVIRENSGKWVLRVSGGVAQVEPGGQGRFRCDVRGLASLYTGFLSPWEAAAAGRLEAPEEELAVAASLFTGSAPWMAQIF